MIPSGRLVAVIFINLLFSSIHKTQPNPEAEHFGVAAKNLRSQQHGAETA
jgi:hypothetical protein